MGFVEGFFSNYVCCVIAAARTCSESGVRVWSAPGVDTGRDAVFLVCARLS